MTTEKPLVSVIMPVYNGADYISEAIKSVMAQSFNQWELLVIDDCSKDDTQEIVKEYCQIDNRIRYLKTDTNTGSPCAPRNIGIENAKGDYLAFLDSDDIWLPNKLEHQIGRLTSFDDAVIVYSNYEKINEGGQRSDRVINAPNSVGYRELLKGNVIGCLTAICKTTKTTGIRFQRIGHEDYAFWLAILKEGGRAYNTNTTEALYRVRENSVSSNKMKVLKWQWSIYRNTEHLTIIESAYFFIHYAIRAFGKSKK